jgi:hypothetical protein
MPSSTRSLLRRAGRAPGSCAAFPDKADVRVRVVARDRARGQAVVNDQMRVLNWTHVPPLAACT